MALSRVHIWAVSEVLTSADLNAEFNNLLNNAASLISPMIAPLAMGGFNISGVASGSPAVPSVAWATNAASGFYSQTGNSFNVIHNGVETFSVLADSGQTLGQFSTASTAAGPVLTFLHTGFPLNDHETGSLRFVALGNVNTTTQYLIGYHTVVRTNADEGGGMSSIHTFGTQNATAGHANVQASLTADGIWADASLASGKHYTGEPMEAVLERLKSLDTLGVYRGKNTREGADKHYSATAEEFYEVFGLGTKPTETLGTMAPKDVSWLAVKAVMELDERVARLEGR